MSIYQSEESKASYQKLLKAQEEFRKHRAEKGDDLGLPYPFCRTPDKCAGKGYCRNDPACND